MTRPSTKVGREETAISPGPSVLSPALSLCPGASDP
jgi:hypothetical protein